MEAKGMQKQQNLKYTVQKQLELHGLCSVDIWKCLCTVTGNIRKYFKLQFLKYCDLVFHFFYSIHYAFSRR